MKTPFVCLLILLAGTQTAPCLEAPEFSLSTLRGLPVELFLPCEFTIGTSFGLASAALRAAGVGGGYSFDRIDWRSVHIVNYTLPDRRVLILHATASDLFPKDFYITAIFVAHIKAPELGEPKKPEDWRVERVERFALP